MEQQAKWKVTFFNELAGRRGLLLDDLTDEEAQAVEAKFGDRDQPMFFLPEVRIEQDTQASA